MAASLRGKTMFVSGGSRGIGLGIALRAAKDGANVVIAAKTATAHPKLPGTIYTAVEEIEKAGGKGLPCVVDIRDEKAVEGAVNEAVTKFGGIDILVNNASAISLTGTLQTPMKMYDLMNNINARGTYLCSKACLPHLKKGSNSHILNISPPLNMKPRWFKNHVAYTMAKYGMSMCALGMAEEFRSDKVAVNALWPKTAIYTAAMEMLGGGAGIASQCRKIDIMSDAAHWILTQNSANTTGNFFIDEEILRKNGETDFDKYACVPGSKLLPDFFLDEFDDFHADLPSGKTPKSADASKVDNVFDSIKKALSPQIVESTGAVFAFKISDSNEEWTLDLKNGGGAVDKKPADSPDCTMTLNSADFVDMFTGKLKPTAAFFKGQLKIAGNMGAAMKLEKLMKKMNSPKL